MANYNDHTNNPRNYRRDLGLNYDEGRFATRGRGYIEQGYKNEDPDLSDEDIILGDYGYGRNHEERDFHIREDKDLNRWHGNYSSDRAYENGFYGRDGGVNPNRRRR